MPSQLTNYLLALLLTLTSPAHAMAPVLASCQTPAPANWFTSRLVQARAGDGDAARLTTLVYGNDGYLQSVTDALQQTEQFRRDAVGRVTTQIQPDQQAIHFSYDPNGNLTTLTPPVQPAYQWEYDPVDLVTRYLAPAPEVGTPPQETLTSYNRDQQLTRVTRPDNQVVDFNYDTGGRLQSLVLPEGTQTFAYHPTSGQLTTVTHTDGSILNYTYDGAFLRAETWSGHLSGSVQQDYNNDFRRTSLKVNGANPITYNYDAEGLLTGAGELTLTRQAQTGLLTGTTLKQVTTQLTHNPFGELASETVQFGESLLYQATYTRDQLGRISQQVETVAGEIRIEEYRYDTQGRLVEVKRDGLVTQTFSYDGNGNRLTTNGVLARYDNQDRLLQVGDVTYTYTTTGNLQTQTQGGQTTHYTYDTLGNLTKVELPNGTVVEYLIDGNDRRVGRKVGGNVTHQWLYHGQLTPIAQVDTQGQVVARYVYGSQDHVPDYLLMGEAIYRLVTDQLGSVRLVVNVMTGEVVQRLDYNVWGNVLNDTNPGFQPFGFAGGLYDSLTGLVHFGARDYDPAVGRWTTKDPIGFASEDTNLYAYVYNDPVNQVDPSGLFLNSMQYDPLGRLVKEENPVGGGWTLSRTQTGANYEASLTSGEGRTTRYAVEMLNEKDMKRVNTAPDGTQSVETTWCNGTTTRLQPDGTVLTQKQGPDPRFGMLSPVLQELKMALPSGLTGTVTTKREATLDATNDLSKPASLTTTLTVNGKSSKSVYTATDKRVVTTSAAGRVMTKLLDEKGRVSQTSIPTLEPVHYTYDARGRLTQVSQGQGADWRTVSLTYDNAGEVSQLTDALGRAVNFAYDAAERVTTQTLPDGRPIFYSYDANGNVTSITPPSRPQHEFDYTAVDLLSQYLPPVLPTLATPQTFYAYNLDKQLTQITRPDGQQVTFNYGASTGRLENLTTPLGTQTLSYDEKGRLVATTTPDNQTLSYTYDGSLPVSETWNGTIAGSLNLSYNNDFRVTSARVNGGPAVTYQYDADGLLLGAGEISLTRTSSTGLLTGTQLGNVTTQRTYNAFGELASEMASYQGNVLSQVQYSRDKLGRIVTKVETSEGVTTTFDYSYDLAGRLVAVKQNGIVTESYEYDANGNRVQALTSSQGMVLGS